MLVSSANQLRQYYTNVGVYEHADGPPAQPPPPCGLAVPDQANNPGLMRDCIALLLAKDTLSGSATLNWDVSRAMSTWDGVTLNADSTRVAKVELDDEDLDGTLPPEIGDLSALTELDLSDNDLSGQLPKELGKMWKLTHLELDRNGLSGEIPLALDALTGLRKLRLFAGNTFTGCVPPALYGVQDSDTASSGLPVCAPPVFDKSHYDFIALEKTTGVGIVSSTDPNGDPLTYSILSGNEKGKFSIVTYPDANGAPVVQLKAVSEFDYDEASEYSLTLEVQDGNGGSRRSRRQRRS